MRFAATGFDGVSCKVAEVVIGPGGEVIVSNYTEFSNANSYVSLDGIAW
jgi:dTDP-4-amino-4,6-dideoxygalactose transaminase